MALKFKLVRNDTMPQIYLSMTDQVTGNPVDLSDPALVVRMYLRPLGETLLKDTLVLVKLPGRVVSIDDQTGAQTISMTPPYDVDGRGGRCALQWGITSLDTEGEFEGEVEVTYPDGGRMTWYELMKFSIRKDFQA